jgi:alanine-synthesizing transaminase
VLWRQTIEATPKKRRSDRRKKTVAFHVRTPPGGENRFLTTVTGPEGPALRLQRKRTMTPLKMLRRQLPYRPTERMNVVSYPIRDIVMEAKREEAKGKKMIYLNIGDPPEYGFRPFQVIVDQVKAALEMNFKGYAPSDGDEELRKTVAKIEKCRPEDVFAVAGLTEGIDFFFHAFIGFGEKLLLPNPVYPLYLSKAKQFEGDTVFYRHNADGQIDVANLSKKIEGAKAMVIINPNNPLGSVYSEKNLAEVVNLCA